MQASRPPRFKTWKLPRTEKTLVLKQYKRSSPRKRGYDARWDRLSKAWRRAHPFCRFCEQESRDELADVTDHILPVVDFPELKHAWSNLQSLCTRHHGLKAAWEIFARGSNQLQQLIFWSSALVHRPPHIAVKEAGKAGSQHV